MSLLLHRRDGVVKARCSSCGELCEVPSSSNGSAVCGKCMSAAVAHADRVSRYLRKRYLVRKIS